MNFEKYVKDGVINLYDLRGNTNNKEIHELINFIQERKDIKEFGFGGHYTIVFSKMDDKVPLWYYQPKAVSLYIYT